MDTVSIDIAAPPETVYDLVADVTQMGRWSPETHRAEWVGGATGPRAGARFKGWNKRGPLRWATGCEVERAERGEEFAFVVRSTGARWAYRFDDDGDGGTRLTETRDLSGEKPLAKVFGTLVRQDEGLRQGMRTTLERLKAAAESGSS